MDQQIGKLREAVILELPVKGADLLRFRTMNTRRGCIHTDKPLEHLCWCLDRNRQQARMILICGTIFKLDRIKYVPFPQRTRL